MLEVVEFLTNVVFCDREIFATDVRTTNTKALNSLPPA